MTVVAALVHTLTDRFLWDVIHIVCTCINDVMMTVTYDTRVLAAFVNSSGPTTSMHWLHTCIICIMFVVKSWSLLVTQCGAFFITTRAWRGCCKLVFIIKSSSTALAIVTNGHVRMCVRVVWLLREPQTPPHCLHTAKSCCVCLGESAYTAEGMLPGDVNTDADTHTGAVAASQGTRPVAYWVTAIIITVKVA